MKKILIGSTLLFATALLVCGLYFEEYPLMWFASTDIDYAYIRGLIVAALLVVVISRPPRRFLVRFALMVAAGALFISTLSMVFNYTIQILDAVLCIEVAIILAIESLEVGLPRMHTVKLQRIVKRSKQLFSFQVPSPAKEN